MTTEEGIYGSWRFLFVTVVTLVRAPAAVAFAIVFLLPERSDLALGIAVGLVIIVELSDLVDGFLARKLGVVSEAGAAIDPWADSISRLTVFWALAVSGEVLAAVPLVMALRDVTVAYCRIAISRKGLSVKSMWSGKIKALVQGAGAIIAASCPLWQACAGGWPLAAVSWAVISVTVLSAAEYLLATKKPVV